MSNLDMSMMRARNHTNIQGPKPYQNYRQIDLSDLQIPTSIPREPDYFSEINLNDLPSSAHHQHNEGNFDTPFSEKLLNPPVTPSSYNRVEVSDWSSAITPQRNAFSPN